MQTIWADIIGQIVQIHSGYLQYYLLISDFIHQYYLLINTHY